MPMSPLVIQFRADHAALVSKFGVVQTSVGNKNHEHARVVLREIKAAILGHLGKEEELYRTLGEARVTDPRAGELHQTFSSEMDTIGKAAMAFFAKFDTAPLDAGFLDELKGIVGVLAKRIYAEENILYPHYDKVVGAESGVANTFAAAAGGSSTSKAGMYMMLGIIGSVVVGIGVLLAMAR